LDFLTLKELKRIELWYTVNEDGMVNEDAKVYEKISSIIQEMEDLEEETPIPAVYANEEDEDEIVDNYTNERFDDEYSDDDF